MAAEQMPEAAEPEPMPAKKPFVLAQNDFYLEIQEGDDLRKVPERFWVNLKTEGVL